MSEVQLYLGDNRDILPTLAENSIDAVVTDPPYGLSKDPDIVDVLTHWLAGDDYNHNGNGFMNKAWDSFVPGPSTWREVYRVMKPGAYALVFAGARTVDLMGIALRLAGFIMHPCIGWVQGQGFPKACNLSKQIDHKNGTEREAIGQKVYADGKTRAAGNVDTMNEGWQRPWRKLDPQRSERLTAPATPLAQQWDGWYYGRQSLKPALEPILMAQKPPDRGMVDNVDFWGCGAINVDGCRVQTSNEPTEWCECED